MVLFFTAPEVIEDAKRDRFGIGRLRQNIAGRLKGALSPQQASVALALLVGQKNAITDEDKQALRDAGLAHMLAISGLHVGLFSGALFFLIRLFLVMIPDLAVRYPAKKIAAVLTLFGAVFYMLIAGMTIPTLRAVLMIAVVFLAIILDRSPISLRLVAFAALIVLLFSPESLLSASFHMSFAAVACLIYAYEVTRSFWMGWYRQEGWYHKLFLYFLGVCFTTVIASLATAPFALYHFGQVSYLGSLANLVAVPLLAFLIMPCALLSLAMMPFGLEHWPLQGVGIGIDYIIEISYWAAALPDAIVKSPAWRFSSFVAIVGSVLFMILWKGWGKIIALPVLVGAMFYVHQPLPDILVAGSHQLFGFKEPGGDLYVSTRRRERFVLRNWEEHYGLPEKSAQLLGYKGSDKAHEFYQCGEDGCRFEMSGKKVSFVRAPYITKTECAWADVLISEHPVKDCRAAYVIDKFDTYRNGAHAVWVGDKVVIKTVAAANSGRPWSAFQSQ